VSFGDKSCFVHTLQGERLVKLAEMCRRMETEEEKVLPFYASSLTAEEKEDIDAAVSEPPNEKLAQVTSDENAYS